jgi:hypothetical protein
MSPWNYRVTIIEPQHHVINSTNLSSALHNRIEHRLHVRRRAANYAEHLGSRCLIFQGFSQISFADILPLQRFGEFPVARFEFLA